MKVLFLTHPVTIDMRMANSFGAFPPLGLGYIAAVLEHAGYDVQILDTLAEGFHIRRKNADENTIRVGLPDTDILNRIREFQPDVVGISNNFTTYHNDAIELAKLIKEHFPAIVLVAGGAHVTMEHDKIIKIPFVDIVIRGEGEYIMRDILDHISQKKSLKSVKGIAWKDCDGTSVVNELAEPISNLDDLPLPAHHLFNMKLYLKQMSYNFAYSKRFPIGHMITSRGCFYNCIFCSTTKHFKKFRARSAEKVLDEIEFLTRKYSVKEIHFHDDSFLCDHQRVYDICHGILKRNIDISWQISQGVAVHDLSLDLLRLMQKSGMYRVGLPIESGSKKMLKFMRKPMKLDNAKKVVKECNRLGIYTHGNFIMGFPHETKEDIEETASFIYETDLDVVKLLICQPYSGSDLYDIYLQEGLLDGVPLGASTCERTKYNTVFFSANELNQKRDNIMKKLAQKKVKRLLSLEGFRELILPKINTLDKIKYFFRVVLLSLKQALLGKELFGV